MSPWRMEFKNNEVVRHKGNECESVQLLFIELVDLESIGDNLYRDGT